MIELMKRYEKETGKNFLNFIAFRDKDVFLEATKKDIWLALGDILEFNVWLIDQLRWRPVENGFGFCPYCGKALVEEKFEYEEGEEEEKEDATELNPTCENCLHFDGCFVDSDEPELPQDEVSVYERCCLGCSCNEGPGECAKGPNMLCDSWEEKEDV